MDGNSLFLKNQSYHPFIIRNLTTVQLTKTIQWVEKINIVEFEDRKASFANKGMLFIHKRLKMF